MGKVNLTYETEEQRLKALYDWEMGGYIRRFFLVQLWRDLAGLSEKSYDNFAHPENMDIEAWRKSEWDENFMSCCECKIESFIKANKDKWVEFTEGMHNRLLLGRLRYGRFDDIEGGKNYDYFQYIVDKVTAYEKDGNQERLIDAANSCMLEYHKGKCVDKNLLFDSEFSYTTSYVFYLTLFGKLYIRGGRNGNFLVTMLCILFVEYCYPENELAAYHGSLDDEEHYESEKSLI